MLVCWPPGVCVRRMQPKAAEFVTMSFFDETFISASIYWAFIDSFTAAHVYA
jgi:hypothetical protein